MRIVSRCSTLRSKVGNDGLLELDELLDSNQEKWKKDVLDTATDRYERRLTEEVGTLRAEMVREFAAVRVEMASMRVSIVRWMFAFWVAQLGAMLTINWLILHAAKLL
jgi:uncharacterized membrane protein